MQNDSRYAMVIEWFDEDDAYIGSFPEWEEQLFKYRLQRWSTPSPSGLSAADDATGQQPAMAHGQPATPAFEG